MPAVSNRPSLSWVLGVYVVSLAVAPLRLAASDTEFPSLWRTKEIVIDGIEDDWAGRLVPIPDSPVSIGVQNDASYLYLCLRTSDEMLKKRIRALGVSFYLDGTGRSERSFGVRYPASPERSSPGAGEAPPSESAGAARLSRPASLDELEIIGPTEAGTRRMKLGDARPVAIALGERDSTLVLEMKIPLATGVDTPFAVQSAPGKTISLGIEGAPPGRGGRSGENRSGQGAGSGDPGSGKGGGGFGPEGGGRAGFGGSMGGGGGRGGHGGGGQGHSAGDRPADAAASVFRKWFRVPLASPPSPPASAAVAPKS